MCLETKMSDFPPTFTVRILKTATATVLHPILVATTKVRTAKLNFGLLEFVKPGHLPGQCLNIQVTRLIWVFKTSTWGEKRSHNMQNCIRSTGIRSWTQPCSSSYQHTHTLGIPWNKDIMWKIVQPCNFIRWHFSQSGKPETVSNEQALQEKGLYIESRWHSFCQKKKKKKVKQPFEWDLPPV